MKMYGFIAKCMIFRFSNAAKPQQSKQDSQPVTLFSQYRKPLMKDLRDSGWSDARAEAKLLQVLRDLWVQGGNAEHTWQLPFGQDGATSSLTSSASDDASAVAADALVAKDATQTAVLKRVLKATADRVELFLFVEGRSGTGKSTLAKCIARRSLKCGHDVVNVATTGLAALQLPEGATAHSTFGIPLDDAPELTCTLGQAFEAGCLAIGDIHGSLSSSSCLCCAAWAFLRIPRGPLGPLESYDDPLDEAPGTISTSLGPPLNSFGMRESFGCGLNIPSERQ